MQWELHLFGIDNNHVKNLLTEKRVTLGYLTGASLLLFPAWMMRDAELVERFEQIESKQPLELYDQAILCGDLPTCFRISHKLVILLLNYVLKIVSQFLSRNLDAVVTEHPVVVEQYLLNIGSFLLFRVLIVVAIIRLLKHFLETWRRTSIGMAGLAFLLSGLPFRVGVEFRDSLLILFGFETGNLNWHFSRQSSIFLLEHDYAGLVAVLVLPAWIARQEASRRAIWNYAAAGFILAITYEHLALVLCVALLWSWRTEPYAVVGRAVAIVLLGWVVPVTALAVFSQEENPDSRENLSLMINYYRSSNFSNLSVVLQLSVGFFLISYLLGRFLEHAQQKSVSPIHATHDLQRSINGVIIGLTLSYGFGMFVSGVISEFGRQTIGMQILLLISGLIHNRRTGVKTRRLWRLGTSGSGKT